jgi:predicted Zn-dependent protease
VERLPRQRVIELEADLFGLELQQRAGFDVKEKLTMNQILIY